MLTEAASPPYVIRLSVDGATDLSPLESRTYDPPIVPPRVVRFGDPSQGYPRRMSLGFSIFLIAAGAILRFAVTVNASVGSVTVNWDIIGDILMAAGVLGLILSIWMMNQARRRTTTDPPYTQVRRRPAAVLS